MKYLSVCSGIEAASVAFKGLGWEPLAFSEIEPFPRAVLQHHYPDTPLYGDFTELKNMPFIEDADLLCGGTPCQAFSVAGLRQSLADDRGNLTLQFIHLADAIDDLRSNTGREPAWILWENVPGVFSTKDNAFGAFLGGLCGRDAAIPKPKDGWPSAGVVDGPTRVAAWRVLDAQHFGLAQRRKRVFVLARGGAGRWAVADALLPIIKGSEWHPAPSRGTGKGTARGFETGPSGGRITDLAPTIDCRAKNGPIQNQLGVGVMEVVPEVTRPLTAAMGTKWNGNGDLESSLIPSVVGTLAAEPGMKQTTYVAFDPAQVNAGTPLPPELCGALTDGAHNGGGLNGQDAYTGRIFPVVFDPAQVTSKANRSNPQPGDPCHTLHRAEPPMLVRMREGKEGGGKGPLVSDDQSLTLATANDQVLALAPTLTASNDPSRSPQSSEVTQQISAVYSSTMQVRRLTPVECERLQGFPPGYTNIPWRGKSESPDGNRYKALGNSWAVPCAEYIGERIVSVTKKPQ